MPTSHLEDRFRPPRREAHCRGPAIRVEGSARIDAPAARVFAFMDCPEHQAQMTPGLATLGGVRRLPGGGWAARYSYRLAGIGFEGRVRAVEYVPGERVVLALSGPLQGLVWWSCVPEGPDTLLTCGAEFTLPPALLRGVAGDYFHGHSERELGAVLAYLQDRLPGVVWGRQARAPR